jgi:hypothetical protein
LGRGHETHTEKIFTTVHAFTIAMGERFSMEKIRIYENLGYEPEGNSES